MTSELHSIFWDRPPLERWSEKGWQPAAPSARSDGLGDLSLGPLFAMAAAFIMPLLPLLVLFIK